MAEVTTAPPGAASCHHVPFGMVVEVGDTNEAVVHACTCPVCLDLALSPAAGSPFSGDESFPFWFESDDDDYEHTPEMLSPDTLHGLSLHDDADRAVSMKGTRASKPKKGKGSTGKIARKDLPAVYSKKVRYHIRVAAKIKAAMQRRADRRAADDEAGRNGAWVQRDVGVPTSRPYYLDRDYAVSQSRNRYERRRSYREERGFDDGAEGHAEPLLSAAELGMDEATYRLILDLQYREITPDDYQTISELDNSVAKKSLNKKKLVLFPTATVRIIQKAPASSASTAADGADGADGADSGILLPGATPRVDSTESAVADGTVVTVVDASGVSHILGMAECPVCACEFEDGEVVRKLPCSHAFHQECIDTWFEQSTTCPNCITEPETPAGELAFDLSSPCSRCATTPAPAPVDEPAAVEAADPGGAPN